MEIFTTIGQYCDFFGKLLLHPLVSVVEFNNADQVREATINWGFYAMFLKETKGCVINYGKTEYDFDAMSVVCIGPGQTTKISKVPDGTEPPRSIGLLFHPDLLFRTSLAGKISRYTFFSYESYEALHLDENERQLVTDIFNRIQNELSCQPDQFSRQLTVSNIELLLDYCLRFYSRQFDIRKPLNDGIISRFESLLDDYIHSSEISELGIPNVKYFADKVALSPNYFGDLVKRSSGQTAQEYIHRKLLSHAKLQLLQGTKNVTEIADSLGFQYPQHFIRFFKNKVGVTPRQFITQNE